MIEACSLEAVAISSRSVFITFWIGSILRRALKLLGLSCNAFRSFSIASSGGMLVFALIIPFILSLVTFGFSSPIARRCIHNSLAALLCVNLSLVASMLKSIVVASPFTPTLLYSPCLWRLSVQIEGWCTLRLLPHPPGLQYHKAVYR